MTPFGSLPKQDLYCLGRPFCHHPLIFPRLSPALYMFHVVGCYSPCSVPPCSCAMSCAKQTDTGWSGILQTAASVQAAQFPQSHSSTTCHLLAQWKSCVLQAVAHWLCKSMCSCDQPSKEMQWEASGSWQTIHRSALHSWVRREKKRGAETQTLSSVYAYQLLGYLHELFYALCKVRTNSMLYSFWA